MNLVTFFKNLFSSKTTHHPTRAFPGIVAARIVEVGKHPNADRLRIVKLDIGDRIVDPVVCGASNLEVGDMVVLALPGAHIPQNIHSETHEPFVLETAKIRGVESQGMICAEFELGVGPLSEKPEIMVLKPETKPGSQFSPEMIK